MANTVTGAKVKISGEGRVTPSLLGRFLFEVLEHFGVPPERRKQGKEFIAARLWQDVAFQQTLDTERRKQFVYDVCEEFGRPDEHHWLADRFRRYIEGVESTVT